MQRTATSSLAAGAPTLQLSFLLLCCTDDMNCVPRAPQAAYPRRRACTAAPRRTRASCTVVMTDTAVLPVPYSTSAAALSDALKQLQPRPRRLYVWIHDCPAVAADERLLYWLSELYGVVAVIDPCWDVTPLLPFAGWEPERIAELGDALAALPASTSTSSSSSGFGKHRPPAKTASSATTTAAASSSSGMSSTGDGDTPHAIIAFPKVAVGGTFDHLHAGHRLLLAATALVATQEVFIGVTADALLASKRHAELLEAYAVREKVAAEVVSQVRPALKVITGALRDPQAPTQAELDPDVSALVVSVETLPGGTAINQGRTARGFLPLELVTVALVGCHDGNPTHLKLSSTQLRQSLAGQQVTT